jgi:hypothetical protein
LEGQLSELRAAKATTEEYEVKVNDLNENVWNKSKECELLKQEVNDLRTALRQIRNEASSHVMFSSELELGQAVIGMVDSFLHSISTTPSKANCSSEYPNNSQCSKILSPRFKKHIELMHSSDSDSADEDSAATNLTTTPTNLMADLSLIAEGKIPPSLCSPDILEEASRLDELSVFDRLANPSSFVGTQKHMRTGRHIPDDLHETSPLSHFDTTETKSTPGEEPLHRHIVSSELGTISNAPSTLTGTPESGVEGSKPSYQSIFDKLGSPSQYTGTQKGKFHDNRIKRDRSTDEAAVKVPNNSHANEFISDGRSPENSDRAEYTKQNVFDRLQKTITHAAATRQSETLHNDNRGNSDAKTNDIVASNFEAGQHRNPQDENRHGSPFWDQVPEDTTSKVPTESRSVVDREAYAKQNVFDRLQKTSTLAMAVRQSETLHLDRSSTENRSGISPISTVTETTSSKKTDVKRTTGVSFATGSTSESSEYAKLNVFERLNKTTTRAYAKKATRNMQGD